MRRVYAAAPYRARAIVVLAASLTKTKTVAEHFRSDPNGFWERKAIELLDECGQRAAELGLSTATVNQECARMLTLLALEATIREAARRA